MRPPLVAAQSPGEPISGATSAGTNSLLGPQPSRLRDRPCARKKSC
jgi:hypothetical protein